MSYTTGGLIEATDFNNFVGANTSSTGTQFNSTWAWGNGNRGWGQTPVPQVSTGDVVTATQWATLINSLNNANVHINGTNSGLTANTAGQLISVIDSLPSKIAGIGTDRNKFASNSAAIANAGGLTAYSPWVVTATAGIDPGTAERSFGARITFNNGPDAARFFFNAGGRLKFNVSSVDNGTTNRSTQVHSLFGFVGGLGLFGSNTSTGRTGTGGTVTANVTTTGYYQLSSANTTIVSVSTTNASYASDVATITARTNGNQGLFGDNGSQVEFWVNITSTAGLNAFPGFDDSFSVTPTVTIDVSFPEVTNISNTWGAVTVTRL